MPKLCVLNFSGNVGKSTFSRHVLVPRLPAARYIAVESINADETSGANEEALRGRKFRELMEQVILADNVVVDVGASNVEEFIARMSDFEGAGRPKGEPTRVLPFGSKTLYLRLAALAQEAGLPLSVFVEGYLEKQFPS